MATKKLNKKPVKKRAPRKRKTAQEAIESFELQSKYAMTLQDKFDMIRMSLQAVVQGYSNSRMILGGAGCLEKNTIINIMVDDDLYKIIKKNQQIAD